MRTRTALIALLLAATASAAHAATTAPDTNSTAPDTDREALWQQPAATLDDPLLQRIGSRLAQQKTVARRFEQQKQLKILQRPLRTSGVMLYRAEQGVCWHTETPVVSTLVLEPAQLRQLGDGDGDGNELVIGAGEQPALFGFTQLFFSLLAGRVDGAVDQFELRVDGTADHWRIGLLPRSALLQRFIARMQLDGGEQVEQVLVTDPDGDRTLIDFSALASVEPALAQRCFGDGN